MQKGYNQNSKYHDYTLLEHTMCVVKAVNEANESIEMLWAALLHDVAKPFVRTENKTILFIDLNIRSSMMQHNQELNIYVFSMSQNRNSMYNININ